VMFRADSLIKKLADGELIQPKDIGLDADDSLPNPRWINFVDKDDLAAYPLAFFYAQSADGSGQPAVVDRHVDVSDNPFEAHSAYWRSKRLAKAIAENW
jgi:hypothetical protein